MFYTFQSRQFVNDIYIYGYSLSLFTLIISLIIFLSFRTLRCTRIRIHTQLFTSLALSCVFWILWYKLVVGSDVIKENPLWCIALHIIAQYLTICNYFWMFCEGVHLHLVLVVVFIKDYVAMRIFFVIGWIMPIIYIVIYSIYLICFHLKVLGRRKSLSTDTRGSSYHLAVVFSDIPSQHRTSLDHKTSP